MVVCISASMKFRESVKNVSKTLNELGVVHLLPVMDLPKNLETPEMVPGLVQEHFDKINKSKSLLVVNPEGYFGNSVKVEIGYAKGKGKKIYFLCRTNQPELDCLADEFISEDELYKLKS